MRDVVCVIGARLGGEPEFGADKCRRQFCDDLFGGMRMRPKAVGKLAVEPVARARPVTEFMSQNTHVAKIAVHRRRAYERLLLRHRDCVSHQRIERLMPSVYNFRSGSGDETRERC